MPTCASCSKNYADAGTHVQPFFAENCRLFERKPPEEVEA